MAGAGVQAKNRMDGGAASDLLTPRSSLARGLFRGVAAMLLGALTAFALFWVMQAIVSVTGKLGEAGARLAIEFVRLKHEEAPEIKKREAPKRQKPEQQPAPPQMNVAKDINPNDAVGDIIPMMDAGSQLQDATAMAATSTDSAPVPLVRVDPEYPPRASQQDLRGFVEVQFTISPLGTTQDLAVLRSKPPGAFDKVTIDAVKRWKYSPMIKNGVAVARPGVQVHFSFDGRRRSR